MHPKLDILAIAAHPDDVEISAGGTILKSIEQGKTVGIVDLTRGELGTRGSGELRMLEAAEASRRLGISARENLGLKDGFFKDDEASMRLLIETIRKYRPEIVLTNAPSDRHPDHGRASKFVNDACFFAGLPKIVTGDFAAHRPKAVYMFVQDYYLKPDFVVDIEAYWDKKIEVLKAYGSQFFDPNSQEPATPISGEDFFDFLKARSKDFARPAALKFAEGFITARIPAVNDLFSLK
jgi:bacillithiol biosynthesis deacetylase BshB1